MQKKEQKIKERILHIENGLFDEDDIKLLLIEIREKLKDETFLKEICHFVAHSERNSGICHKKVDVRYAKLKFIKDNQIQILTKDFIEENKHQPESFFSDAVLNNYFKTEKIDKKLFELIILSGIDDIENALFLKYYKLNKTQVKKLVSNSYKKDNGYYITKTTLNQHEFFFLDDLLKFIRGTITGKPAFTQKEIIDDFTKGLKKLSTELDHKLDLKKIQEHKNDLIVCILSLLHDSTFTLFDGMIGSGFLSITTDVNPRICLKSEAGNFILPLITTEIKAQNYIDSDIEEITKFGFRKLPWYNCIRNDKGELKLIKYKA
ncbi:hypothetical protein [Flavobacterium sp. LB2P53]|uniref:hypothetical protein n=1 Tax=Flavobacterium sp. LB2P53 TaxID=2497481 RepID=UPI000F83F0B6|nr:hypothetical protein [Flavobacterium sp. LB2P53]RTY67118.1 hypothetical protein EKL95_10080 [Flavobacterium sp. LB2P53]